MKTLSHLESKFLYYTEVQLATLERLLNKRSAKFDINRQQHICNGMMETVHEIAQGIDLESYGICKLPRVRELLTSSRNIQV